MGNVKNEVLMDVKDSVIKLEFALGEKGVPGEKGEKGERGEPGEKGEKGEVFREVTYTELKELRDSELLIPGMRYCITDYEFTCNQEKSNIEMQGVLITVECIRRYNIIVEAVSCRELSEVAKACNREGEEPFDDILSWSLRYSIDNDVSKYNWAESTNGRGVVYWLQDGQCNEFSFDSKSVEYSMGFRSFNFSVFKQNNTIRCIDEVYSLPRVFNPYNTLIKDTKIEYQEGSGMLCNVRDIMKNVFIKLENGCIYDIMTVSLLDSSLISCPKISFSAEDSCDIYVRNSQCTIIGSCKSITIKDSQNITIRSSNSINVIDSRDLDLRSCNKCEVFNSEDIEISNFKNAKIIESIRIISGDTADLKNVDIRNTDSVGFLNACSDCVQIANCEDISINSFGYTTENEKNFFPLKLRNCKDIIFENILGSIILESKNEISHLTLYNNSGLVRNMKFIDLNEESASNEDYENIEMYREDLFLYIRNGRFREIELKYFLQELIAEE